MIIFNIYYNIFLFGCYYPQIGLPFIDFNIFTQYTD
jgi:hypothetical protein